MPEGMQLDFLRASSYMGASTTGVEAVTLGLVSKIPVEGRHILLVEDIIDTGKTLQVDYLSLGKQASSAQSGTHPDVFCNGSHL